MATNLEERYGLRRPAGNQQQNNGGNIMSAVNNQQGGQNQRDFIPAEFFVNIGIPTGYDGEGNYDFLWLNQPYPLDTIKDADTKVRNPELAHFRQAQNFLRDDAVEIAMKNLKPGEDMFWFGDPNGLQARIRRRGEDVVEPNGRNNPFLRSISLAPQAGGEDEAPETKGKGKSE